MSILKSTHTGKVLIWYKEIERIAKHIVEIAEEKEIHGADCICLKYDCPSKAYKNGKISTYRCKLNLYFKNRLYNLESTYNTILTAFKSAVDGTAFSVEDISTSSITIEIDMYR